MICRTTTLLGLFYAALFCGGCGTMKNLDPSYPTNGGEIAPPTRIYGGIRQDWTDLKAERFDDVYCMNLIFLPLYLADFPLSLIGDTVTLPYTTGVEVVRYINAYFAPPELTKTSQASKPQSLP